VEILRPFVCEQRDRGTAIICLFTGRLPPFCEAMSRLPSPEIGMPLDGSFHALFAEATKLNPAIHDGAIMVGRTSPSDAYLIAGWSFRLFAGHAPTTPPVTNRGSAFNSCLSMSQVEGVDRIYLATRGRLEKFVAGRSIVCDRLDAV